MTKRRIKIQELLNNPESQIELLSEYEKSKASQALKKTIINGPHLDPDILFKCATDPSYQAADESFQHIAICPICMEEFIVLQHAHRELWGDNFNPVEVEQFDLLQFLKDIVSSGKMVIRSFVDRVTEVIEPEPIVLGLMTTDGRGRPPDLPRKPTTPKRKLVRQSIETNQFLSDEEFYILMPIQRDGYVTAFTLSESGDMRLVFPSGEKVDTSVSAQEVKKILFTAPEPPGRWSLKAIWTIDDPLGSLELPVDEFWNDKALQCLAEHIKESDEDEWAAGTFEFEVKKK